MTNQSLDILNSLLFSAQKTLYLLGRAGCGKTTIAKGLAREWLSQNKPVFVLSFASLIVEPFKHYYQDINITQGFFHITYYEAEVFSFSEYQLINFYKGISVLNQLIEVMPNCLLIIDGLAYWFDRASEANLDLSPLFSLAKKSQKLIIAEQDIPQNVTTQRPFFSGFQGTYLIDDFLDIKLEQQLKEVKKYEESSEIIKVKLLDFSQPYVTH